MKKLLAIVLSLCMLLAFAGCSDANTSSGSDADEAKVLSIDEVELTVADKIEAVAKEDLKVGFIFLHDANSTYDKNFIDAANAACEALGIKDDQVIMKTGIPEGEECYTTAKELVNAGCQVIFADSFGHEPYMVKAAKEYPKVQFCHATGVRGKTEGLGNYHTAFAEIYKGRYLAGIAAGMKLNEMIKAGKFTAEEAKIGYVGAFPYAEVISGYTSFYLGVKSVCPTVKMEVQYTQSWFDIEKENTAAKALIANGCKLISQHADSSGAPSACEAAGVPNVAYNVDTSNIGPNTAIISSKISWVPYMTMMIKAMLEGTSIPADYCATLEEGAVQLTALTKNAAPGTQEAIDAAKAKLSDGSLKVFDTKNFTVDGKELTTYLADVVDMGDFVPDTEAVVDGRFIESEKRSAPYFNVIIDGITVPKN
ncbi:MAG: BMP family ABC transporter substrate-binding protein [Clostridia bacterium]|nr:BMP family ABC transporter substrate-binding protein [Oscillospiraceae bacterium]MBP3600426.1 BMP family ABC transporter substrate-binding protein [Clostridia bacterium]